MRLKSLGLLVVTVMLSHSLVMASVATGMNIEANSSAELQTSPAGLTDRHVSLVEIRCPDAEPSPASVKYRFAFESGSTPRSMLGWTASSNPGAVRASRGEPPELVRARLQVFRL